MTNIESNYLKRKKLFRATGLLNKSQLKLASYIKNNKNVTLQGTKRFMDKSGEYYLKNVQMQNRKQDFNYHKRGSLNNPQNLENCLNDNLSKIKKRASKIVTLLPENSLTPIPKKEGINKTGFANGIKKKELNDAQRTAVFIRRLEYSTSVKRKMVKGNKDYENKVILIQEWWRTMLKIIKLQKNIRGFIFRKNLMNSLEHQEKLYQFITEFDNIYNYHALRHFLDNLKKKRDYEKAKYMEKCEDFGEKLENLEIMNNFKNLKKYFDRWKKANKKQKKLALNNLAKKLNNILKTKFNEKKLDTLKKIENKAKKEEKNLNDKIKNFRKKKAKEKFIKNLKRAHQLNKILNKIKEKKDKKHLKEAFDKLKKYYNLSKILEKLNELLNNKLKQIFMNNLKKIYFAEKLNDIIQKCINKICDENKKIFLDKLKEINNKKILKDNLNRWNNICKGMNNKRNIINLLAKYKKVENERRKKELINFNFGDSEEKLNKIEQMNILKKQLNNLTIYNNNKKLKKYLSKWKSYIERKEIKENLLKFQQKKIAKDKLKSILNKLQKIYNKNDLRKYFDKYKEISKKLKQRSLESLIETLIKILDKAKKESDEELKKHSFETLRKNNDIIKGVEKLHKLLDNKPLKYALNALKKNAGMSEGFRILDKFFTKKYLEYQKDFYDKLKKNSDIQKAAEILDKLISDKIKKDVLENLIKKSKQEKGFEILDKIFNKKLLKKTLDRLVMNNNIQKACEILEKIINKKLLEDTWKKLISMDFVDLLQRYENKYKQNKKEKDKKIKRVINNLKKLKKDENKDLMKKYLDKWKDIVERRKIKDSLLEKALLKKAFNNWRNMKEFKDISEALEKSIQKKKYEIERKNIFMKVRRKKLLGNVLNKLEKSNLNNLKKYFDIWKQKLNSIKEKEKCLNNLYNIYKTAENNLLKKYLNNWLSNSKKEEKEEEEDVPKYKKKPRIKEKEIIIEEDTNEFNPTYYNSKINLFKSNNIPFKKYLKKENMHIEQSQRFDYIETQEEEAPKIKKNLMKLKKYNMEDDYSSSNEGTNQGLGEILIQKERLVREPRNYTSQSFFIDKNLKNNLIDSKNYSINSYNKNILPMKMKGDFINLIEQNPKILEQKNPRIQVTNATCNLAQIINNDENEDNDLTQEEIANEIEKLNDNFIIDKNKVLSRVIKNCDKDLYAAQATFKTKKDKYYSVGIPLNNNEAKWEFLGDIRGERGKNNTNKFELIQKEPQTMKEDLSYYKKTVIKRKNVGEGNNRRDKDNSFKLKEINFLQYYRSPMKSQRKEENSIEIIRNHRLNKFKKRQNTLALFWTNSEKKRNLKNKYNIDRSHGKIELNPEYRTLDYDDDNDNLEGNY